MFYAIIYFMNYYIKNTRIGNLTVVENASFITHIIFGAKDFEGKNELTPLIAQTFEQLEEYFEGKRREFDVPCKPEGTEFQQKVWNFLQKIPYGETRTYKEIAVLLGNPNASRAVGSANNKNPIPIIIPCHRVIGSKGALVGYAGGLDIKTFLLNLEGYLI